MNRQLDSDADRARRLPETHMPSLVALTPHGPCCAEIAIAASRAHAWGILDLEHAHSTERAASVVELLGQNAASGRWGLRWDAAATSIDSDWPLARLPRAPWPVLILAGIEGDATALKAAVDLARPLATQVWLEVHSLAQAEAAQAAGCDALIVKGNEAAGRVGDESTFLLLQRLRGQITIPYFAQGGIGPDTAAAAHVAGAGVVLREQLWLTKESPLDEEGRRRWGQLDGSETATVSTSAGIYRFYCRANRAALADVDRALAEGHDIHEVIRSRLTREDGSDDALIPLGQEIAFARELARQHQTVEGVLKAYRDRIRRNPAAARKQKALCPGGPLAASLGTKYPILQGPMTRVSDVAPFCEAVAAGGGLPFLALALMSGPECQKLLDETKQLMGDRPWGVGILGFVPAEIRKAQLEVIRQIRPPYAVIAGGRPSQAKQLEQYGITTFLHVPSPGLLESFVRDGARRFILEGRECGGHVGPRSSFTLWQSAINTLTSLEIERPEELQIVFAGGIHDGLSAAMVAASAAPLVERGIQVGALMGTAYLFTEEAVRCGAIVPEYQRQAIECRGTVLLESGIGHATRCIENPFAEEFNEARRELIRAGKTPDEIRLELEVLNIGRLRIASKGVDRGRSVPGEKTQLLPVDSAEQYRRGIYMIGQVAALRHGVTTVAALHETVSGGYLPFLESQKPASEKRVADKTARPASHDIAIVGIGGLFPSATNVRRYWSNIINRVDLVKEIPPDRWDVDSFFNPDRSAPDQIYSRWGSFVDPVRFDPLKWMIPPATIAAVEPAQLMALDIALDALNDAGLEEGRVPRERTGVLFTMSCCHDICLDYIFRTQVRHHLPKVSSLSKEEVTRVLDELGGMLPEWTEDSFPGYLVNVVSGRISNRFDLRGPNYLLDAACASSLAALHAGVQELRSGTCDAVLVGAVDVANGPHAYMSFAKTRALSPTGRSRPFDDSADGIALGEAITAVVIKRLEDAERDGDKIYAVLRGMGSSSDGRARSLTAPHPPGQVLALQRAYEDAGFDLGTVTLIEAHGTGTAVGDSSEITSLNTAFDGRIEGKQRIAVGSVKSMIGHTKSAAGLVSLVKAVLALNQQTLPPTIGVTQPNTLIDFSQSPFYVNTETRPWFAADETPRRAGVSAFGFGGTNFHVVLEEYTGPAADAEPLDLLPRSAELFVWTGSDRTAVASRLNRLIGQLATRAADKFDDLAELSAAVSTEESEAHSAGAKAPARCRLSLIATSMAELRTLLARAVDVVKAGQPLNDPAGLYYSEAAPIDPASVCFLYPGQGSQSVDMLRELVVSSQWSRTIFEEADRLTGSQLPESLSRTIYPPPSFTDAEREVRRTAINQTQAAQPALGVVEVFATELLERFGVRPAVVAGHSYGEYVALWAAGVLSRSDLIRVSAERGRIASAANATAAGAMAAVRADEATTRDLLAQVGSTAWPANLNAPDQTVIAGPQDAVEDAIRAFSSRNLRASRLPVTAAFHTPLMQAAADEFARFLQNIPLQSARRPVTSNTTAARHADDADAIRQLLAQHLTTPVQFVRQIEGMHRDGARVFVEVGPGRVLTSLVERILGADAIALSLDAPGRPGWQQLAHLLGRLVALGYPVDAAAWCRGRGLSRATTESLLEAHRTRTEPKPSDWILSASRSTPASGSPARPMQQFAHQAASAPINGHAAPAAPKTATHEQTSAGHASSQVGSVGSTPRATRPVRPSAAPPPASTPRSPQSVPRAPRLAAHPPVASSPGNVGKPMMTESAEHELSLAAPTELPPVAAPAGSMQQFMQQWMELQTAHLRVTERFLTLQERMFYGAAPSVLESSARAIAAPSTNGNGHVLHAEAGALHESANPATQNGSSPAHAAPQIAAPRRAVKPPVPVRAAAPAVAAPPAAVRAPVALRTAAPRPVEPAAHAPTPQREKPAAAPVTIPTAAPVAAPAPVTPAPTPASPVAQSASEVPTVEAFELDLLQAVSDRTGYPTAVLNLDMALESGLGIDSIKTIEIFNKLKKYHPIFRTGDEDEEETMASFTRLKTLRDIVQMFRTRLAAYSGGAAPAATAAPASSGPAVERFALASVDAAADEKKNGSHVIRA